MVTTPQELALVDVRKAIDMFRLVDVPIIGIVENFATYFCQKCGHEEKLFGENGGNLLANEYQLNILQSLPLDTRFRQACDQGRPIFDEKQSGLFLKFTHLANQVVEFTKTNQLTTKNT